MAPVVHHREAVEEARGRVENTLVIVESFKIIDGSPVRYKSTNGFIIDAVNGRVYVAVPQSKLSGDSFNVRFQNNVESEARIWYTAFDLFILEIVAEGNFHRVNIANLPRERTNIIILAPAKMEDELRYSTYTSSVIIPRNETLPTSTAKLKVFQSPDFLTIDFSANMEIKDIVGAPIFDFDGTFLGIIHSCDKEKVVFARSSHFIADVRMRILEKNQM